jgi:Holliday junction resolvase
MYGQSGLPDIVCCYKGRFIAFEVKTDKGKTTILQEVMLRKIRAAGGIAEVVRSAEEVKAVIAGI